MRIATTLLAIIRVRFGTAICRDALWSADVGGAGIGSANPENRDGKPIEVCNVYGPSGRPDVTLFLI